MLAFTFLGETHPGSPENRATTRRHRPRPDQGWARCRFSRSWHQKKSKICSVFTFPLTHRDAALTPAPLELSEKRGESRDAHQRLTLPSFSPCLWSNFQQRAHFGPLPHLIAVYSFGRSSIPNHMTSTALCSRTATHNQCRAWENQVSSSPTMLRWERLHLCAVSQIGFNLQKAAKSRHQPFHGS